MKLDGSGEHSSKSHISRFPGCKMSDSGPLGWNRFSWRVNENKSRYQAVNYGWAFAQALLGEQMTLGFTQPIVTGVDLQGVTELTQ